MAVFNADPTSQVTVTIPVPSAVNPSQPAQPAPSPAYQPSQQVSSSLPPEEPPHEESSYTVILPHSGAGLVKPKQSLSRAGALRRGPKPVVKLRRVAVPLRRYALNPDSHRAIARETYEAHNSLNFGVPAGYQDRLKRFVKAHKDLADHLEESGHEAAAEFTRRYLDAFLKKNGTAYQWGSAPFRDPPRKHPGLTYTSYPTGELSLQHGLGGGVDHVFHIVSGIPPEQRDELIRRFEAEGIPEYVKALSAPRIPNYIQMARRISRSRHYAAATPESVRGFILSGKPKEEIKAALADHFEEHDMEHLAKAMRNGDPSDWFRTGRLGQQTPVSYENFQHPLLVQIKKYKVGDPRNNLAPYSVQIMPEAYHIDRGFVKPAFIFYGTHDKNHISGLIDELTRFHGGGGFTTPGEPGYEWATSKWITADSPENIELGLHHLIGEEA